MEEVVVSAPVQECLDMEVDKVEGDANGDGVGKSSIASVDQEMIVTSPAANGDGKSSISNTNAPDKSASRDICSPAATADQIMIVLTPAATVDGKSSISSTNALDKTASHDVLSLAATVDQQMTVLSPAPVQECLVMETDKDEVSAKLTMSQKMNRRRKLKMKQNKNLASLDKREDTENPSTTLGAIASVDPKRMVLSPAATVEEKSSIPSTNATDQIASGDILSTKVHEAVSGEMSSGKTVTDSTTSKKRKRNQRAKKTVAGDVLSAKVDEIVSGETVPDKAVTDNTTPKKKKRKKRKKKVAGDVLSAKVNEVVSGETVPSKTTTNNTTPKRKKRNKKKRKLKTVAGDILSTCENIQGKVNAIEGSSAMEVTEAISGEMVLGKTALPDVKMVSNEEEHTEATNGKMRSSATTNLNVNGAVNSSLTIGEILTPQNLQNLKAENGETGPGTTAADTTASKKKKRRKKKKKSPLSGDILSTSENIQDKVNAIDGLSTTKVLDTKVTNKTELSDITNHNVDDKKGPEVVNSEIGASNTTSKQKTKKQKVDVNPSENKEITKATPGKKLVIFEVDGMLADIVFPHPKDVEADKYSHGEAVFKRPYLDGFLSFCFEKFNVGIWSSRMKKKNLDPVVDCLFGDLKKKLLFTWSGFHCRNSGMRTIEDRDKCIVFKELRKIWETNGPSWVKGTFNESNTLLLDDSPYKALLNPKHTGIFPTSYKYTDMNDDCLGPTGALRAYLEGFAAADDGRTYVEQNPFGQGPIDEMNRDWKYYSRVLKGRKLYCTSRGLMEVTEAISGEMVLGKTALPDVKMVSKEEEHTEAANGKMGSSATGNLNVNGTVNSSLTIGEILTPQNLQNLKADNGETGSGTTAADTTASKKRERGRKRKKSPLSGDISSTSENIQDKVNAIDGLSTTKVLDTKVTNKTELSDITNHNVDGKKGPEVVNSEIGASNSKQKTKKQKVDVNPSENKEVTKATLGKKLVIFDVNGLLADIVYPRPKDVEADKYSRGKAVFKRPYLDDFLSFCFEKFNVGIWSSRMKKNLDPVVDCLFGDLKKKLLFIWDASHCRNSGMRTLEDRYKCIVFKELRKFWEKNGRSWVKGTFNESNTLLLDDSPYKALLNPKHTGIFPTSYKYADTNDDCLGPTGALRAYLEGFAAADDGRTYVEHNPFGQGPIDEMDRDWNYYSRVLKSQKQYCTSQGLTIQM